MRPDLPAEHFAELVWTAAACLAAVVQRTALEPDNQLLGAFERAGEPAWYPEQLAEGLQPWQPLKLYYTVWAKQRLMAVHEALLRLRGSSPYDQAWLDRPGHDDRITTRLHIGAYLWARSGSLRAHATQVDPNEPWWFGLSDAQLAEVYPWEDWILAVSAVDTVLPEDDLLAGLRGRMSW